VRRRATGELGWLAGTAGGSSRERLLGVSRGGAAPFGGGLVSWGVLARGDAGVPAKRVGE